MADSEHFTPGSGARFIAAFNTIEAWLRHRSATRRFQGFAELVRNEDHRVVRRYAADLLAYAELRNAISHASSSRLIAVPTDQAVADLEAIRDAIANPPTINSVLGIRTVVTCASGDSIQKAAAEMLAGDFSQLPIYDESRFAGLLTAETITRWVAVMLARGGGILEESPIREVMTHTEDPDNHMFLAPTATAFDALDGFDAFNARGKTLDAILVTADARQDATPLNIVAIYDAPALLRATTLIRRN